MAHAFGCPCGHRACTSWMVGPHAAVQGVRFTKEEAEVVAKVLSGEAVVITTGSKSGTNLAKEHIEKETVLLKTFLFDAKEVVVLNEGD